MTVREDTLHDYAFQEVSTTYWNGDVENGAVPQKETIKTAAAKFILALKEKHKLTQTALDYAINTVDKLLLMSSEAVEQGIDRGHYLSSFDNFKTEYQQTKYYKENFGLIVSVFVVQQFQQLFLCRSHELVSWIHHSDTNKQEQRGNW